MKCWYCTEIDAAPPSRRTNLPPPPTGHELMSLFPTPSPSSPPTYAAAPNSASASHSTASAAASRSRPKRVGYWNRRGDHLVETEVPSSSSPGRMRKVYYVVYAPVGHTYPDELQSYPAPEYGWADHRGMYLKHDPNFEEYPDSLPKRGQPPRQPYESVRASVSQDRCGGY